MSIWTKTRANMKKDTCQDENLPVSFRDSPPEIWRDTWVRMLSAHAQHVVGQRLVSKQVRVSQTFTGKVQGVYRCRSCRRRRCWCRSCSSSWRFSPCCCCRGFCFVPSCRGLIFRSRIFLSFSKSLIFRSQYQIKGSKYQDYKQRA